MGNTTVCFVGLVISAAAYIAAVIWYLFFNSGRFRGVSWKYACSALFIAVAAFSSGLIRCCTPAVNCYAVFMLVGFIFSWFGDVMLDLEGDKNFIRGVLFFAIAHINFITSYCFIFKSRLGYLFNRYELIAVAVIFVVELAIFIIEKYPHTLKTLSMLLYGTVLTVMMVKAVSLGIQSGGKIFATVSLGGIMFFVSDFILLKIVYGGKNDRLHVRLNLSTYYLAQLLLGLSMIFIR